MINYIYCKYRKEKRMTIILFIGMPCSGKSTIAEKVSDELNIPYVSSGDIAREMAANNNDIRNILNSGEMAPEIMMRGEIAKRYMRAKENGTDIILDGFPRFQEQLIWLKKTFPNAELLCVYISTTIRNAYIRNASRNRDDNEAMDKRIHYYIKNTYPLISNNSGLHRILIFNNDAPLTSSMLGYITESIRKEL